MPVFIYRDIRHTIGDIHHYLIVGLDVYDSRDGKVVLQVFHPIADILYARSLDNLTAAIGAGQAYNYYLPVLGNLSIEDNFVLFTAVKGMIGAVIFAVLLIDVCNAEGDIEHNFVRGGNVHRI